LRKADSVRSGASALAPMAGESQVIPRRTKTHRQARWAVVGMRHFSKRRAYPFAVSNKRTQIRLYTTLKLPAGID
jgi:hypothetical protein